MGVFCDKLKFGSTAALDCRTGQNKSRYGKKRALIATRLIGPPDPFGIIQNLQRFTLPQTRIWLRTDGS